MSSIQSLLLSESGLFDFDLTFPAEILLFFTLSFIITKVFLNPISIQLAKRAEFLDTTMKRSLVLLNLGYEKVDTTMSLVIQEIEEMNRQLKLVKEYTTEKFDQEVDFVQKESLFLLSKLKGELAIKSAFLFSSLLGDINLTVEKFFEKKFKS
jgi:hypothetical protein